MTQGIKDPITGKTYTYKGFTPLARVSESCKSDSHSICSSSPQQLITQLDFEFTKSVCCLCSCHFEEVK